MTEPGWYPNPDGSPSVRWWDGQQWTGQVQLQPGVRPRRSPGSVVLQVLAVVCIVLVLGYLGYHSIS